MEIYPCGLSPVIFTVIGASVIQVITIYFTITEAEADIVLFNQDSVWEDFQSKLFPILTCNLESAEPILLIVSFKTSRSYTIQEAICSVESTNQNLTVMSPWWNKSSSEEAKKKTSGGGIFGLLKRKLKGPSESKQISSRKRSEIASEMGCNPLASSPSTLVAQFAERPHTHPLPHPENLSVMGRVDSGKWTSRNRESGRGSSPLFLFPLPKSDIAQNGHDQTDVEGDLATDSVFTDSDSDEGLEFDSRIISPQLSNYVTGNKSSTNSPSSHVAFVTQKEREKLKRAKACVSYQMSPGSPKRYPLSRHMVHLQIPQSTSFFSAPDSSMSTPSRSPMRVFGPEPTPTSGFWAMRPYTDTSFLGPGLCSSPGLGHNPSHKEIADQSFWQHNICSYECSPMLSPRMTSPGPSSRPVTPLHPWVGGSNMDSSANWPGGAVNGKQQTHRLPLPPLAVSNTGIYSPLYSTRTTPTIPKSPGRADLFASHGSGWKKGRLLGRGTFGQVYLGFNSERGEMCAMKEVTLFSDDARSKESAQQLAQEIALLSRLRHPNIVQYYGSETVDDKLYIYLEYVSGGSIYRLLQEYGEFGEIAIRSYTRQILLGLAYLHSTNTVHRDIKGANILVEPNGRVKLADFGMAKHITGPSCSLSFKGSPHWMAPEIINNNSDGCNLVVDIWSLGCTVLEMATTKPPWSQFEGVAALFKVGHSQEVQAIPDHLSDDAKDFILQCLQKSPSLRPSAAQLLQHPFVNNIPSSERLILNPGLITNAMGSLDIGHASEGVSVLQSSRHMPHNISSPVSHMGILLRTGQNVNRRVSLSPISSPRTILGSSTPLTGAAGVGAVPFYHNVQKPYTPEFTGLTLTSRSPTRSFGQPSNAFHLLDPKRDMFRPMPQGFPFVQEMVPPDNDFQGNLKKHMAGKSVLVDHGSQKVSKHHIDRHPPVIIKPTSPVVGRREQR